ncbi:hypothetical protein HUG10_15230 [Halorarum halophilum]|uniref:DUF7343 domain-containing protein n=1 Tax=Halorarum halophilum TaxID=2743090 RepID=A0A7D5GYP3_9EURY|nr:hypothetical protein [Halobaculum halophilum]QLG28809.1 hypothetical protein HUG10_15230 [Halobaculum halophilum]
MESTLTRIWQKVSRTASLGIESVGDSTESVEARESSEEDASSEDRSSFGERSSFEEGETGSESPLGDYDPSALCSRRHFVTELGISHDEFFARLIEDQSGSLPQKEFTEFTSLSSSTVSRILREMEDDEQVVRVQIGRENIVYLPEHAPAGSVSRTDTADVRIHA